MYQPYVTPTEYAALGYTAIPTDQVEKMLREASRNVDTLTFNRISRIGFDHLTEFQQEIVKETVCKQADFLFENADAIASVLEKYSINGVSMEFGSGFNVAIENGLPIQSTVLSVLRQTGLCWRGAL